MNKNPLAEADLFGIAASSICAIHCIATPIALALLPTYVGEAWESPLVHQLCAGGVALFCIMAAAQGYKKHQEAKVLIPMGLGLLFVIVATFFLPEQYEMPVLSMGSAALVIGHIWNMRRVSQCCNSCPPTVKVESANETAPTETATFTDEKSLMDQASTPERVEA